MTATMTATLTSEGTITRWVNTLTGERLDRHELEVLQAQAHTVYEANTHIFEDEFEALTALGVVPMHQLLAA